jgi:hypothetical protein
LDGSVTASNLESKKVLYYAALLVAEGLKEQANLEHIQKLNVMVAQLPMPSICSVQQVADDCPDTSKCALYTRGPMRHFILLNKST